MAVGLIRRQDDTAALPNQNALLREALGQIKGGGRTAQSLRAGLFEKAMAGGLQQDKLAQDQAQFGVDASLRDRALTQKQSQFDQTLGLERDKVATEAISGLRSGLGRPPLGQGVGQLPQRRSAFRSGSSFSDGTMDPLEEDPLAMKNGGVIGNVKKDTGEDQVPVVAREGEYFLNPETVAHIGGGDYKQGLRSLNALVREATGKEPGPSPVGKSGLRGFATGGPVDSPERLAWLKDIAQRGNQMPEAQAALRTFNEAQVGPEQPPAPAPEAPVSLRRLPDEPRPVEPTLRDSLDARASATMQAFQQDVAAERANGSAIGNAIKAATGLRAKMQAQTNEASPEQLGQTSADTPTKATGMSLSDLVPSKEAVQNYLVGLNERVTGRAAAVEPGAQERTFGAMTGQQAEPAAAPVVVQPTDPVAAFRTRNAEAENLRREWQRQSPGGLRNANQQALDTYNAEQQTRGTGISARRQANGVMEFSGSGPAPQAQYIDANGNPTNEWRDTSEYRSAVARQIGSGDENLRRRGLAAAMDLAQLDRSRSSGSVTGNAEMDRLLGQMEPREAAAVFRALNGGRDGKAPSGASYSEQSKRVEDLLGKDEMKAAMPEIQRAQANLVQRMVQSAQMSPQDAQAAVQQGMFMPELARAYQLRGLMADNGQMGNAVEGAGTWAGLGGLLAGGGALLATRNPAFAAQMAAAGGAGGAAFGGANGYSGGVAGFDKTAPLDQLLFDNNMGNALQQNGNGDFVISGSVVPKSFVQKNYRLFGLSSPPQ